MRVGQSLSQAWAKTRWSEPKWVQHPGRRSTKDFWGPLEPSKTTAMPFGPPLSPSPSRPSGGPWGLSGASLKFWGGAAGALLDVPRPSEALPKGVTAFAPLGRLGSNIGPRDPPGDGPGAGSRSRGQRHPGAGERVGQQRVGFLEAFWGLYEAPGLLRSRRPSRCPPPAPPLDF